MIPIVFGLESSLESVFK